MRCGASCLLALYDRAIGASKQLAPHLYTAKLLLKRLNSFGRFRIKTPLGHYADK